MDVLAFEGDGCDIHRVQSNPPTGTIGEMNGPDIPHLRLHNQWIAQHDLRTPAEVVAHLGAVQAQDYAGGKWAIGLRLPNATEADIEQAIAERTIVRTWPMRRTLQFVPAADVRWMLALTASRAEAKFTGRQRQLELDSETFRHSGNVLEKALSGSNSLSRQTIYRLFEEAGIRMEGSGPLDSGNVRGLHILAHHAQTGLICYGPHQGKQPAFVLLDKWVPESRALDREEALAELAKRYFTSHGPATVYDFAWWSGLAVRDATTGIEMASRHLVKEVIDGRAFWLPPSEPDTTDSSRSVHILPPFDEYTVAYKDRSAVVAPEHVGLASSGGVFRPIIVVDGRVVGTWKASARKRTIAVMPMPFDRLNKAVQGGFANAAARYANFLGIPLSVD
jgi:hypothetical protein